MGDIIMSDHFHTFDDNIEIFEKETSNSLVLAFVGEVSSGKSTAIKKLFGVDPGDISPVPGTTKQLKSKLFWDNVILLDTPGLQDVKKEISELAKRAYKCTDLFLVLISAQGGVKSSDRQMVSKIYEFNKPIVVLITKLDTIASDDDRKKLVEHAKENLKDLTEDIIPVIFEADKRLLKSEPHLIEDEKDSKAFVLNWISMQLDSNKKILLLSKLLKEYTYKSSIKANEYISRIDFWDKNTTIREESINKHIESIIDSISKEFSITINDKEKTEISHSANIDWSQLLKEMQSKQNNAGIYLFASRSIISFFLPLTGFSFLATLKASAMICAEYLANKKEKDINKIFEDIKEEIVKETCTSITARRKFDKTYRKASKKDSQNGKPNYQKAAEEALDEYQYCSWCYKKTRHRLVERHLTARNDYQCTECKNYTVQCRFCKNMATAKPYEIEDKAFFKSLSDKWNSELCAEHDGSIAGFKNLSLKLNDLEDYEKLFHGEKWNLAKGGKILGCVIAGAAVFCPLSYLAAPGIASALGAAGLLGTAGTGTAISTLSGAALTNASLSAIGFGSTMASGVVFVSAAGGALGAVHGAVISNSYFGAIKDFKIQKVNEGTGPALIFINGFLSQKNQDSKDWRAAVKSKFMNNPWYFITWEAKSNYEIGSLITRGTGIAAIQQLIKKVAAKASKKFVKTINPINWISIVANLINNPWHSAMVKASMTGILLADLLARTKQSEGFILMGHSLGTRVIYYLLNALSTKDKSCIKDVYLLGGTVDRTDKKGWEASLKAVNGNLYNCYSRKDAVLKSFLYAGATALISKPIGLDNINISNPKLHNIDTTDIVDSHMMYKNKFDRILNRLHG
jgi:small GTP-binding protein